MTGTPSVVGVGYVVLLLLRFFAGRITFAFSNSRSSLGSGMSCSSG